MKRDIKNLAIGFLVGCMLTTTTPIMAESIVQTIDVVMNGVNVEVEGQNLDSSSILYNGITYLPLRKVAEAVGKEVEWDQTTMTANIVEPMVVETPIVNSEVNSNMVEEDILNEFSTIGRSNDYNPIVVGKSGETYYTVNKVIEMINEHGNFTFDNNYGNISFISIDDGSKVVENVEYVLYRGVLYISQTYYETSILPLIK